MDDVVRCPGQGPEHEDIVSGCGEQHPLAVATPNNATGVHGIQPRALVGRANLQRTPKSPFRVLDGCFPAGIVEDEVVTAQSIIHDPAEGRIPAVCRGGPKGRAPVRSGQPPESGNRGTGPSATNLDEDDPRAEFVGMVAALTRGRVRGARRPSYRARPGMDAHEAFAHAFQAVIDSDPVFYRVFPNVTSYVRDLIGP
jgi:hypothetical protein